MAYTQHGHQIPGTIVELPKPNVTARCGGPRMCRLCQNDVQLWQTTATDIETPMAFTTDNAGLPNIYIDKARQLVVEKYNRDILDLVATPLLTPEEVYVVWFTKTLQNWKALVSTDRDDGRYYELTYDGNKEITYVDVYKKISNETIADDQR